MDAWKLTKLPELVNPQKTYFPAYLRISLNRIIVPAPSIPHFKGLGMRNLQYEISIYQKINNKATMTISSYFDFC